MSAIAFKEELVVSVAYYKINDFHFNSSVSDLSKFCNKNNNNKQKNKSNKVHHCNMLSQVNLVREVIEIGDDAVETIEFNALEGIEAIQTIDSEELEKQSEDSYCHLSERNLDEVREYILKEGPGTRNKYGIAIQNHRYQS